MLQRTAGMQEAVADQVSSCCCHGHTKEPAAATATLRVPAQPPSSAYKGGAAFWAWASCLILCRPLNQS